VPDAATQIDASQATLLDALEQIDPESEELVALFTAPWTVDSVGQPVPSSLSVGGSVIRLTVNHRASSATYPVIADPAVIATGAYENGLTATASDDPQFVVSGNGDLNDCKPGHSPCGQFYRGLAREYAYKWYNDWNGEYKNYGENDCTNFLSQSLRAGKFRFMREFKHGHLSWWSKRIGPVEGQVDNTESWRLVMKSYSHLIQTGRGQYLPNGEGNWKVGDIVFYSWGNGGALYDHANMVTRVANNGQTAFITQGTTNEYRDERFAKIKDRVRRKYADPFWIVVRPVKSKANI